MRIIDRKWSVDYYDHMIVHGIDPLCVFTRMPAIIESPLPTQTAMFRERMEIPRGSKAARRTWRAKAHHVYVAGKAYPIITVRVYDGRDYQHPNCIWCYTKKEFEESAANFQNDYSWFDAQDDVLSGNHFATGPIDVTEWCVENRVVTGITGVSRDWYFGKAIEKAPLMMQMNKGERSAILVNHARLREVEFYRVMSGESVFTEISNFILCNMTERETVEVGNESKIIKNGFDARQSFRHRK